MAQNYETRESLLKSSAFEMFARLVMEGEYFKAHETLEILWYPLRFEKRDEILLIKGYINASTAFELFKRGRGDAALKIWNVYLKYRPLSRNLDPDLAKICEKVERVLETTFDRLFRAKSESEIK